MSRSSSWPRVRFAIRFPAGDGRWRYEHPDIVHPDGSGSVPMEYPPAIGDLIHIWDRHGTGELSGTFRVLERDWMHASYGSADFPYSEREPRTGPLLEILCEPADRLYRDEAPMCGYEDCWARLLFGEWVPRPDYGDPEPHEHKPAETP